MRIGIDFDNTIANYEHSFRALAQSHFGLAAGDLSKQEIRDTLRAGSPEGEDEWTALQGMVYGPNIHYAEPMPGFYDFLQRATSLGADLFIVSHKTEFAKIDPTETPLRKVAMDWLGKAGITAATSNQSLIQTDRVFFCDTRQSKVETIRSLNLDYFIDDLIEVFQEPTFPSNVRKLLFTFSNSSKQGDASTLPLKTWSEISEYIFFGIPSVEQMRAWTGSETLTVKPLSEGGNNRLYKIVGEIAHKSWLLKSYLHDKSPEGIEKAYARLHQEKLTLKLLNQHCPDFAPSLVTSSAHDKSDSCVSILMEYVEGAPSTPITKDKMEILLQSICTLQSLSQRVSPALFPQEAKEACWTSADIVAQIGNRVQMLEDASRTLNSPELSTVLNSISDLVSTHRDRSATLSFRPWPILSPSDFGFHNSQMRPEPDGSASIVWLDFEYFGWDSQIKMLCDLLLHPAMMDNADFSGPFAIADPLKLQLMNNFFELPQNPENNCIHASLCSVVKQSMPLFALRWAVIVLAPFSPEYRERQHYLNLEEIESLRKSRLERAKFYINLATRNDWTRWFPSHHDNQAPNR